MLHELRIYRSMPGKLSALHQRFSTITLKLWTKHQIRPVGFWTVLIGKTNQDLYYLLQWESLAEREQKWHQFTTDPEWIRARDETERGGPLIAHATNYLLSPTEYSPSQANLLKESG
jgi:hypothetical protein